MPGVDHDELDGDLVQLREAAPAGPPMAPEGPDGADPEVDARRWVCRAYRLLLVGLAAADADGGHARVALPALDVLAARELSRTRRDDAAGIAGVLLGRAQEWSGGCDLDGDAVHRGAVRLVEQVGDDTLRPAVVRLAELARRAEADGREWVGPAAAVLPAVTLLLAVVLAAATFDAVFSSGDERARVQEELVAYCERYEPDEAL